MNRSGPLPPPPEDEEDGGRPGASWLRVTGVLGAGVETWTCGWYGRDREGWGVDGANGSELMGWLLYEIGSGEEYRPTAPEGSAMTGVAGWISVVLVAVFVVGGFAVGFACLASLCAFVVKLSLTLFMPEVRLSISDLAELECCFVGNAVLLDLDGTSTVPSCPRDARPFSARGDFRRPGKGLEASARGWVGALVFFTTTGGAEWSRELVAEPGRGPEEVLGLDDMPAVPLDGLLLCPFGNGGASDITDPASDAALRRRLDCLVACA